MRITPKNTFYFKDHKGRVWLVETEIIRTYRFKLPLNKKNK